MTISIIACISKDGGIGKGNELLFHIPEDTTRFRLLTTGHPIIMGRKTFDSLPHGALPNRRNIVISHQDLSLAHCEVCHSLEEALNICQEKKEILDRSQTQSKEQEVFIIGGESIYRQAIPIANKIYLTKVNKSVLDVDTYFPPIDLKEWKICEESSHIGYNSYNTEQERGTKDTFSFSFITLQKV